MKEIWSVIIDFPMYKISTFGRVKSLYTNKILKPINKNGYRFVTLVEGNKFGNYINDIARIFNLLYGLSVYQ